MANVKFKVSNGNSGGGEFKLLFESPPSGGLNQSEVVISNPSVFVLGVTEISTVEFLISCAEFDFNVEHDVNILADGVNTYEPDNKLVDLRAFITSMSVEVENYTGISQLEIKDERLQLSASDTFNNIVEINDKYPFRINPSNNVYINNSTREGAYPNGWDAETVLTYDELISEAGLNSNVSVYYNDPVEQTNISRVEVQTVNGVFTIRNRINE